MAKEGQLVSRSKAVGALSKQKRALEAVQKALATQSAKVVAAIAAADKEIASLSGEDAKGKAAKKAAPAKKAKAEKPAKKAKAEKAEKPAKKAKAEKKAKGEKKAKAEKVKGKGGKKSRQTEAEYDEFDI